MTKLALFALPFLAFSNTPKRAIGDTFTRTIVYTQTTQNLGGASTQSEVTYTQNIKVFQGGEAIANKTISTDYDNPVSTMTTPAGNFELVDIPQLEYQNGAFAFGLEYTLPQGDIYEFVSFYSVSIEGYGYEGDPLTSRIYLFDGDTGEMESGGDLAIYGNNAKASVTAIYNDLDNPYFYSGSAPMGNFGEVRNGYQKAVISISLIVRQTGTPTPPYYDGYTQYTFREDIETPRFDYNYYATNNILYEIRPFEINENAPLHGLYAEIYAFANNDIFVSFIYKTANGARASLPSLASRLAVYYDGAQLPATFTYTNAVLNPYNEPLYGWKVESVGAGHNLNGFAVLFDYSPAFSETLTEELIDGLEKTANQGYAMGNASNPRNFWGWLEAGAPVLDSFLNIPIMGSDFTIGGLIGVAVGILILGFVIKWFI